MGYRETIDAVRDRNASCEAWILSRHGNVDNVSAFFAGWDAALQSEERRRTVRRGAPAQQAKGATVIARACNESTVVGVTEQPGIKN